MFYYLIVKYLVNGCEKHFLWNNKINKEKWYQ